MEKSTLIKFLNDQASKNEVEEVLVWLDQPDVQKKMEDILEQDLVDLEISENTEVYKRILDGIHRKTIDNSKTVSGSRSVGSKLKFLTTLAASLVLIGFITFFLLSQVPQTKPSLAEIPIKQYQKRAGFGEKLKITLPDKTFVILNSLSELNFDADFGKKDRLVSLKGEAFFEISPDASRPFKVSTGKLVTTALGTAFNAFAREGTEIIALTEGKVSVLKSLDYKVDEVILSPGDLVFQPGDGEENFQVKNFDSEVISAWKEGEIIFKSKSLEAIMNDLETWYGVSIEYAGKVDKRRKLSGTFENENLKNILEGLTFSMGIKYELKGTKVTIKP